jgi:hypothetical protein
MEILFLNNKPWNYVRFGLGVLSLIAALLIFLYDHANLRVFDYLMIISFSFVGVVHLTNDFGMQKAFLRPDGDSLAIKWINKYRTRSVNYSEIESIYIRKTEIIINQKDRESLKLKLETFRTDQKREIYQFFINLSKKLDLNLSRQL